MDGREVAPGRPHMLSTAVGYCCWLLLLATAVGYCCWLLLLATAVGYCSWLLDGSVLFSGDGGQGSEQSMWLGVWASAEKQSCRRSCGSSIAEGQGPKSVDEQQ